MSGHETKPLTDDVYTLNQEAINLEKWHSSLEKTTQHDNENNREESSLMSPGSLDQKGDTC
jgi:hypothetical protein